MEETKIQIKDMIQNIKDSLDLDYLNDEQVKELYKKQKLALETALNYIENSIPKEVIQNKLNEIEKQYKEALEENSTEAFILKCQIEILEELLKGK